MALDKKSIETAVEIFEPEDLRRELYDSRDSVSFKPSAEKYAGQNIKRFLDYAASGKIVSMAQEIESAVKNVTEAKDIILKTFPDAGKFINNAKNKVKEVICKVHEYGKNNLPAVIIPVAGVLLAGCAFLKNPACRNNFVEVVKKTVEIAKNAGRLIVKDFARRSVTVIKKFSEAAKVCSDSWKCVKEQCGGFINDVKTFLSNGVSKVINLFH